MPVLRWAGRLWTGVLLITVLLSGIILGLRLILPLPLFSQRPAVLTTAPLDGAIDVTPRSQITVRFNTPMNPRAVERALRVEPALPAVLFWSDDYTTITISPTQILRPETNYRVIIEQPAWSRTFRGFEQAAQIGFLTTTAPSVVTVLPADGANNVQNTTPISIQFSQPIVDEALVGVPLDVPQLQFDPPLPGRTTWVDQSTALFRPNAPLQPGTRYQATLDAGLTDVVGGQLDQTFAWSFATEGPRLLSITPGDGMRDVTLQTPLSLQFSQPLDPDSVRDALVIDPPTEVQLDADLLPDGTQVITLAPTGGWLADQAYTIDLSAGVAPLAGNLALERGRSWGFQTAPQPRVIGRFPGEGQTLQPGQEIRLIFNTPVDAEALREALQFSPAVDEVDVRAGDTEARITATLQPATVYTVTLSAQLTDRNQVPIDQEYQFRFLSAAAAPDLQLPEARHNLIRLNPGRSGVLIQRTNLSTLTAELYGLDEATLVRALAFSEADWRIFNPERTGQTRLRNWSLQLSDPLNRPTIDQLELTAEGEPALAPGAYYLRVRTPEGPRADVLLLVSRTRLIVQHGGTQALVWATDAVDGTPIDGLQVGLYRDGALIERGITDEDGLWSVARLASNRQRPLVAVASGGAPGGVSSAWSGDVAVEEVPQFRAFITTDRTAYLPGETVGLAGFVRLTDGQENRLPPGTLQGTLTLRRTSAADIVQTLRIATGSGGVIDTELALPADLEQGTYIASITFGDNIFSTRFAVRDQEISPFAVTIQPPSQPVAGQDAPVQITVTAQNGVAFPEAQVAWTLETERAPFPTLTGFSIGDPNQEAPQFEPLSGTGFTGADGRLTVVITGTERVVDAPMRYRLYAQVSDPGGAAVRESVSFTVAPGQAYVGIALPGRLLEAGQEQTIDLTSVTAQGVRMPNIPLRIEIIRAGEPGETVLTRNLSTDSAGRAALPLTLSGGGVYQLRATATDSAGRENSTIVPFWVPAGGFTDWPREAGGQLELIADRTQYQAGDTVRLLVPTPFAAASALVSIRRDETITSTVQTLRPGDLLEIPLADAEPPLVQVAVALVEQPATISADTGDSQVLFASLTLPVQPREPALRVELTTDLEQYRPGATAQITVTTTDAQGAGVPADIVLGLVDAASAPQRDPTVAFRGDTIPQIVSATQSTGAPPTVGERNVFQRSTLAQTQPTGLTAYWDATLRTSNSGLLTVTVQLPRDDTTLRALVWAAGPDRFAHHQRSLVVQNPVTLDVETPPFLRAQDVFTVTARMGNNSATPQRVRLNLSLSGAQAGKTDELTRVLELDPGSETVATWTVTAATETVANIRLAALTDDTGTLNFQRTLAILPATGMTHAHAGMLVDGRRTHVIDLDEAERNGWGSLVLESATEEAALIRGTAEALAAQPFPSVTDDAGLLLISTTYTTTADLAAAPLRRLIQAQNGDGGWGWWPSSSSDPFVTAFVLEAFAAAQERELTLPAPVVNRGLAALRRSSGDPANLAYVQYVLAQYDAADAAVLDDLAATSRTLGAEEIAYLLLARPFEQERDGVLLARLEALASRRGDGALWPATDTQPTSSTTSATAQAALTLMRDRPDSNLLPLARRWLINTRGVGGWHNGYASARAALALGALAPTQAQPTSTTNITLNNRPLVALQNTETLTSTQRYTTTLDRLQARNNLIVTGTLLLSQRITTDALPVVQQEHEIRLLREYYDPQTGALLEPDTIVVGQLVGARLTVIAGVGTRFVRIQEALPAGMLLTGTGNGDFGLVASDTTTLLLARTEVGPGIYQYSYTMRALHPGRYSAPATTVYRFDGALIGSGNAHQLTVRATR